MAGERGGVAPMARRHERRRRRCQLGEEGRKGKEGHGLVGRLSLPGRSWPKGRLGRLTTGPKVEENFFYDKN
jgi:hypothetical protein